MPSPPDYAKAIAPSRLPAKEQILASIKTGLALKTAPSSRSRPSLGHSRLGGLPDVPPDFRWPTWKGKSQEFIAQVDLASVPMIDDPDRRLIPASGYLYFFYDQGQETWGYDPAHRGSSAVIYSDVPAGALTRAEAPADFDASRRRSCLVTAFEPVQTAPAFDSHYIERLGLDEAAIDRYIQILDDVEKKAGMIEGDDDDGITEHGPFHQMLGHPRTVQNPMEFECELVRAGLYCGDSRGYTDPRAEALKANRDDWVHLLQVDSDEFYERDEKVGWCWGDVGRIYYWIRRDDLRERRFENVWLILQCS